MTLPPVTPTLALPVPRDFADAGVPFLRRGGGFGLPSSSPC